MATPKRSTDEIGPRDHEKTWGASEPAKAHWNDRFAEPVRKAVEKDNEKKEVGGA